MLDAKVARPRQLHGRGRLDCCGPGHQASRGRCRARLGAADEAAAATALRIDFAMSANASSWLAQDVTGRPSVGTAFSLPNGALRQSHARRMTGVTRASPALCRSKARVISVAKQYSDAMKFALTSSKMMLDFSSCSSILSSRLSPATMRLSCHAEIRPSRFISDRWISSWSRSDSSTCVYEKKTDAIPCPAEEFRSLVIAAKATVTIARGVSSARPRVAG